MQAITQNANPSIANSAFNNAGSSLVQSGEQIRNTTDNLSAQNHSNPQVEVNNNLLQSGTKIHKENSNIINARSWMS
jgi:hypothetical protein